MNPSVSLAFNPDTAVAHLEKTDARLADLIARAGPYRPRMRAGNSPFLVLLRSIVYQQLSGRAAGTIHQRVLDLFEGQPNPRDLLALDEETLRASGLSRAKVAAVRDLAGHALDGSVPGLAALREMPDDEIVKCLTAVRGVGRWTVEMLLLFYLGRPDVLPVQDLGVRKGFARTFERDELPGAKELTQFAEAWRPYRSVASWYMWRATELIAVE